MQIPSKHILVIAILLGLIQAVSVRAQNAMQWDEITDDLLDQETSWVFHFVDDKTGFVSTALGAVVQTTDGGLTWRPAYDGSEDGGNRNYFFLSASVWFSEPSIDGKLWGRTIDAGKHWEFSENSKCPNVEPFFLAADVGWGTSDSSICTTRDGGKTWSVVVDHPGGVNSLGSIFMLDNTHGWVAGDNHQILATTDGTHWVPRPIDPSMGVAEIHFFDRNNGFAKAGGRPGGQKVESILYSKDGGQHWLPSTWSAPVSKGMLDILGNCVTQGTQGVWVIGGFLKATSTRKRGPLAQYDFVLFHSSDGGASFQSVGKLPDEADRPKFIAVAAQQGKPVLLLLDSNGALWQASLPAN